jgi:hypothetical protein
VGFIASRLDVIGGVRRRFRVRALGILDVLGPLALFGIVVASWETKHLRSVAGEDGVLEWGQVAAFAVAVWALFSAAAHVVGRARLAYLGAGVVVVGVIGEELAWGTRLIGSGITFVEAHNDQGDTTLHNLGSALDVSFLGIVAAASMLGLLVVLRWSPFRAVPLSLAWWLFVPAVFAAYRVIAGDVPYRVAKLSEAAEVVFAVAVARLALSARSREALRNTGF